LFATPTRAKRRNCVFAPPPKIGHKNLSAAEFCIFGGFSAGPNFSAAAAKFGG